MTNTTAIEDAERIKRWREWAGLTPVQLAERCGVTPEAVYQWESGTNHPKRANVDKMCSAFRISLGEFWGQLPPVRTIS